MVASLVVLLAGSVATAAPAPSPPTTIPSPISMAYHDGLLSVRLAGVPLEQVIAELERTTGAEVRGELLDRRKVYKRFDDLPLPQALDRLLGAQNFILMYGGDGSLVVDLLGKPGSPQVAPRRGGQAPNRPTAAGWAPPGPTVRAVRPARPVHPGQPGARRR